MIERCANRIADRRGTGRLDRTEFVLLASVLYESLAVRIAAQSAISLSLAPLGSYQLVAYLGPVRLGALGSLADAVYMLVAALLPPGLAVYVGQQAVAVTTLTATVVAVLVPFAISLVDEYYFLKASRRARRALLAEERRRAGMPWSGGGGGGGTR